MSKPTGNTRLITPKQKRISSARKEYLNLVSQDNVDKEKSYFSEKTGSHAIFMKGHNHSDKLIDAEAELEVARAIADYGVDVKLTPEGDKYKMYATSVKIGKDGGKTYKFSEGLIATFTFEQKTPTEIENTAEISVKQAINHANSKRAQIAVIYDKHKLFNRNNIENGMKLYQSKHKMWETKGVKAVLVVNHDKVVYEHQFDKK